MLTVNMLLNRIHEWGEPEEHPIKRIALTRLACLGAVALECFCTVEAAWSLGNQLYSTTKVLAGKGLYHIFPKSPLFQNFATQGLNTQAIGTSLLQICKLIVGLASTLLIGVIFSPEINFRLHLRMGLAVDNLLVRKQKDLAAKLAAEAKAAELAQVRAIRFAQFQAEQRAAKDAGKPKPIDSHLAELLVPALAVRV